MGGLLALAGLLFLITALLLFFRGISADVDVKDKLPMIVSSVLLLCYAADLGFFGAMMLVARFKGGHETEVNLIPLVAPTFLFVLFWVGSIVANYWNDSVGWISMIFSAVVLTGYILFFVKPDFAKAEIKGYLLIGVHILALLVIILSMIDTISFMMVGYIFILFVYLAYIVFAFFDVIPLSREAKEEKVEEMKEKAPLEEPVEEKSHSASSNALLTLLCLVAIIAFGAFWIVLGFINVIAAPWNDIALGATAALTILCLRGFSAFKR